MPARRPLILSLSKDEVAQSTQRGQLVEHHLALAPGSDQSGCAQHANMVGDEFGGALAHPRQIANAQLATVTQSEREWAMLSMPG